MRCITLLLVFFRQTNLLHERLEAMEKEHLARWTAKVANISAEAEHRTHLLQKELDETRQANIKLQEVVVELQAQSLPVLSSSPSSMVATTPRNALLEKSVMIELLVRNPSPFFLSFLFRREKQ